MTTNEWIWQPEGGVGRSGLRPFSWYDSLWQANVHKRLEHQLQTATRIPFNNSSRFIFLSDCHRGDGSATDLFAHNRELFLQTLHHYYRQGFTYLEVGDGDDLWQTPCFESIYRAHSAVFHLMHHFHQESRLHILIGNHDMPHGALPTDKAGLPLQEGVVLQHTGTGQEILVVHGHQADFADSRLTFFSRLAVRHIWKRWQHLGTEDGRTAVSGKFAPLIQQIYCWSRENGMRLEQKLMEWVNHNHQMLICGHTHVARFAQGRIPYFNTGSCVNPGYLTGLEIQNGEITPVKWRNGRCEPLAAPRKLSLFTP